MITPRLLTTGKCVGGEEPFYASISIVIPDLNSTVKCSVKTVIFSMSFLTRASSNSVMSVSCPAMKSCSSLIRFMASSRWWVSSSDCSFWSRSRKISSAMASYFENYKELINKTFNPNSFYCTPEGISVYYQQYDIAPYSSGIREFLMPYTYCVKNPETLLEFS